LVNRKKIQLKIKQSAINEAVRWRRKLQLRRQLSGVLIKNILKYI